MRKQYSEHMYFFTVKTMLLNIFISTFICFKILLFQDDLMKSEDEKKKLKNKIEVKT